MDTLPSDIIEARATIMMRNAWVYICKKQKKLEIVRTKIDT